MAYLSDDTRREECESGRFDGLLSIMDIARKACECGDDLVQSPTEKIRSSLDKWWQQAIADPQRDVFECDSNNMPEGSSSVGKVFSVERALDGLCVQLGVSSIKEDVHNDDKNDEGAATFQLLADCDDVTVDPSTGSFLVVCDYDIDVEHIQDDTAHFHATTQPLIDSLDDATSRTSEGCVHLNSDEIECDNGLVNEEMSRGEALNEDWWNSEWNEDEMFPPGNEGLGIFPKLSQDSPSGSLFNQKIVEYDEYDDNLRCNMAYESDAPINYGGRYQFIPRPN